MKFIYLKYLNVKKISIITVFIILLSVNLTAQEEKKSNVIFYEDDGITIIDKGESFHCLLINKGANGISLYQTLIFNSKEGVILFFEIILRLLEHEKTDKEKNLDLQFYDTRLVRYGKKQKSIFVYKNNATSIISKKPVILVLEALNK